MTTHRTFDEQVKSLPYTCATALAETPKGLRAMRLVLQNNGCLKEITNDELFDAEEYHIEPEVI